MDAKLIGLKIKKLRNNFNMTQDDLAKFLSVNRETISKWERGIYIPNLEYLFVISQLFEISIDNLICTEQQKNHGLN